MNTTQDPTPTDPNERRIAGLIGRRYEETLQNYNTAWTRAVSEDAKRRREAYEAALDARFQREAIEAYEAAHPRPTYEEIADRLLSLERPDRHIGSCDDPTTRAAWVARYANIYAEQKR